MDFFKGTIPHHQGAIDMTNVELQYGKDPETKKPRNQETKKPRNQETKKLAEDIIKVQEIEMMKEWLAKKAN